MKLRVAIVSAAVVLAVTVLNGPGAPALAVPPNDDLANAQVITTPAASGIVATGTNVGATFEGGESQPCGNVGSTVWFTWTSPASPGTVVFDTWGSGFDTVIAVYTGSSFPLTPEGCSDDFNGLLSALEFSYAASTTYRLQVGGYSGAQGDAVLNMSTGAALYVSNILDTNAPDAGLTLREAMLLAKGGTGAAGLNRSLDGNEVPFTLNAGVAGATGSDLVHFLPGIFQAGTPATISLTSSLPGLYQSNDNVSGVGAGVIIDGLGASISCFPVSGSGNHIEGLQITGCRGGNGAISVTGAGNVIGGADVAAQRNVIRGGLPAAASSGILLSGAGATGNSVLGNFIGTNSAGTAAQGSAAGVWITLGAHDNTIGGSAPGEGNLISGNNSGVTLGTGAGESNRVLGNRIGTDVSGAVALPNVNTGVYVQGPNTIIGGPNEGEGNVISGNGLGINLGDSPAYMQPIPFAIIQGNKIGTDAFGAGALPNTTAGIRIASGYDSALNIIVGGTGPGQGNTIAYNAGAGIFVDSATSNTFRGNSIHSNAALGIDTSSGGNTEPAPPVIASVTGGTVSGFACSLCTVDVYNDLEDEGRVYLGWTIAEAAGNFSLSGVGHSLANLTATATDAAGNTSEFTLPFAAAPNSDGDGLADSSDGCPFDPEDADGFEDGDGCPDTDNDLDGIPDVSDVGRYTWQNPLGGTVDCKNVAEDFDGFHDGDGCPEPDNDNDTFPDGTDDCPATDANIGPDGIADTGDEPVFYLTPYQAMEDFDGIIDWDGCHDSPGDDYDGDGFSDEAEVLTIGTNAVYPCGFSSWPADLWDQPPFSANKITIQDLTAFIAPVRRLGTSPGDPNFNERWDLVPGKGIFSATINIQDMTAIVTLAPPMLNGARALNGPACPLPSQ